MLALLVVLQGAQWSVSPPTATVGDTVVIERVLELSAAGVRARVSAIESSSSIEPLGEPTVSYEVDGVRIRYTIAVFAPGTLQVELSEIALMHVDGEFETVGGGTAIVVVESVLPIVSDSSPEARPSLAPIGRVTSNLNLAGILPVVVLLAATIWGVLRRRRRPRPTWDSGGSDVVAPPVARWIQAGEPRAVAALAMAHIREKLQVLAPETNLAMSNGEVLVVLNEKYPDWPIGDLSNALLSLERANFAPAVAADVMAVVESAEEALRAIEEIQTLELTPVDV